MSSSVDLMDKYFGGYFPHLGINSQAVPGPGPRCLPDDENEPSRCRCWRSS